MVALNRNYPFTDYPSASLSEDVLAEVVDLRARGRSWEETASAVQWDVAELRRATRHDPNYAAAYAIAEREVQQEADAEGMRLLRTLMTDKKPHIALAAAKVATRYLSEKRRDETHLEVERLRAEARVARAEEKRVGAEERVSGDEPRPSPEEEREWAAREREIEEKWATDAVESRTMIYVWGGQHRIIDTPPDASDIPAQLVRDKDALVAGKPVYWVVAHPFPTHPLFGSFPARGYTPPQPQPLPESDAPPG